MTFPAVPALLDEFTDRCLQIFAANGRSFTAHEREFLQSALRQELDRAFSSSQRSSVTVSYKAAVGEVLNYQVCARFWSLQEAYDQWIAVRQPPYFGTEPDAQVCALAFAHAHPNDCPIVDVGAGTGRNALALARRGYPVDAVELNAQFAGILQTDAQAASLNVRVLNQDLVSNPSLPRSDYALMVVSEVVPDFRSTSDLRALFSLASAHLRTGGQLAINAFLARDFYVPVEAHRQFAQQVYSMFFTREELKAAYACLPLELVSDVAVLAYEKENQPPDVWPPTGWYSEWVLGRDVFDMDAEDCPIEMRWLVFRKLA